MVPRQFSPAQLALATGVIASPWIAKPIFGFISDSIPIFGMRRRSYLFIFGLTGFASYWALHAWARTTVPVVGVAVWGLVQHLLCERARGGADR
jgi:hypothetical protein